MFGETVVDEAYSGESSADHTVRCFIDGHNFLRLPAGDSSVKRMGRVPETLETDAKREMGNAGEVPIVGTKFVTVSSAAG